MLLLLPPELLHMVAERLTDPVSKAHLYRVLGWHASYWRTVMCMPPQNFASYLDLAGSTPTELRHYANVIIQWVYRAKSRYLAITMKENQHLHLPLLQTLQATLFNTNEVEKLAYAACAHDEGRITVEWASAKANIHLGMVPMLSQALQYGAYAFIDWCLSSHTYSQQQLDTAFGLSLAHSSVEVLEHHLAHVRGFRDYCEQRACSTGAVSQALRKAAFINDVTKLEWIASMFKGGTMRDRHVSEVLCGHRIKASTVQWLYDHGHMKDLTTSVRFEQFSVLYICHKLGLIHENGIRVQRCLPTNFLGDEYVEEQMQWFKWIRQTPSLGLADLLFRTAVGIHNQDTRVLQALKEAGYTFRGKTFHPECLEAGAVACFEFCEREGMVLGDVHEGLCAYIDDHSIPGLIWLMQRGRLTLTQSMLSTAVIRNHVRLCQFLFTQDARLLSPSFANTLLNNEAWVTSPYKAAAWLLDVKEQRKASFKVTANHLIFAMREGSVVMCKRIYAALDEADDRKLSRDLLGAMSSAASSNHCDILHWFCDTFTFDEAMLNLLKQHHAAQFSLPMPRRWGVHAAVLLERRFPQHLPPSYLKNIAFTKAELEKKRII